MSKRLQALIEQTQFLLARQEEAKETCSTAFSGLLDRIDKKLKASAADEAQRLQRVHEILSGQAQQLMQDTEGDIDFLRDQLKALTDITKIQDQARAKELLGMLIDPSEEIMPTADFKQSVMEELAASQEGFNAVIEDLSAALEEGDIKNIEVMLEQMAASAAEDAEDDEDEEEEEDGCCGSSSCAPGGCGSCEVGCGSSSKEGVDIFGSLSAYDRELAKDKESSDQH